MSRFIKLGVIIVIVGVLGLSIPGVRERGTLLVRKLSGASSESWSDLAVQMVPFRWQERMRQTLGHWAVEWIRRLDFPLELHAQKRRSDQIFLGATPNLNSLDCHYTVLAQGESPHPPHIHDEEEIIVPLIGDVDILRATADDLSRTREEHIGFGRLVYHSSRLPHTIRAVGPGPSAYLVLRWSAPSTGKAPDGAITAQSFDLGILSPAPAGSEGRSRTVIFEGPTLLLQRLHAHASLVQVGEGSAPHQDAHDVAVVVLKGEVETTSGRVEAPGIIFHPAGRTHFIRATGTQPARYVAIEFLKRN